MSAQFIDPIHNWWSYITIIAEKITCLSPSIYSKLKHIFQVLSKKKNINSPIRLINIKPCVCDRSELLGAYVNAKLK